MDHNIKALFLAVITGILIVIVGIFAVGELIPFGYVESSIIYLAGVIGAGLFWIGSRR